jgi:hypothetical protein
VRTVPSGESSTRLEIELIHATTTEPTEEDAEEDLERVETDTGRRRRTAADEEEELRRAIEESMKVRSICVVEVV